MSLPASDPNRISGFLALRRAIASDPALLDEGLALANAAVAAQLAKLSRRCPDCLAIYQGERCPHCWTRAR